MTPETPEFAAVEPPELSAPAAPAAAPASAVQEPQERPPPLPAPLVHIWESFVLDQAQRGRNEVHLMVPILISMLSERGVANLRPDEKRRRRLERWHNVLKTELAKIAQAKTQSGDALQDGFRTVDIEQSSPIAPGSEDQGRPISYSAVLIFTRSALEEHKRAVNAQMAPTTAGLKELDRQQEVMVRHRLQLMQRLSSHSDELLEIGHGVVRKFQASELERITMGTDAEADVDAALASLLPPPVRVTYRFLFNTLWLKIERLIAPFMAWEPPAVRAWRRRVKAQLAARR